MENDSFWQMLDTLVESSRIIIDRPKGSRHPRYPEDIYPLDYGYLEATIAGDGQGIDVWRGSSPTQAVTTIILTIDLVKRDSEIKILLGCTAEEKQLILARHRQGSQSALLIERPIEQQS